MDILVIAHFVTEFAKHGTSRFVYLAEQLSEQNEVELVTSSFDHFKKKQRTKESINLKTKITMLYEPSYSKNVCIKRFKSHAEFGKKVRGYLKSRKKPDVIYCAVPSLECAYFAAKYAKKNNIKFIIDVQDLWPEAFKLVVPIPVISDLLFYPMSRKAKHIYSKADVIVGVSETYCKHALSKNQKKDISFPIFLGTKIDLFDNYALENRVVRNEDKFVIGYCGTLGHSYDIKCVLDAMVKLKEEGCEKVSFWIMGDGPLKSNFEKYASQRNLDVTFFGRLPYEKMCGLLASCDVCVNPINKGATQSIINKHGDYAASGLPVINTQAASEYRRLVERYNCGINCECGSSVDVAKAIAFLLSHRAEREEMGKNSRKMAEELFDRNNSYAHILKLFE